jgi:hypothetical protein
MNMSAEERLVLVACARRVTAYDWARDKEADEDDDEEEDDDGESEDGEEAEDSDEEAEDNEEAEEEDGAEDGVEEQPPCKRVKVN